MEENKEHIQYIDELIKVFAHDCDGAIISSMRTTFRKLASAAMQDGFDNGYQLGYESALKDSKKNLHMKLTQKAKYKLYAYKNNNTGEWLNICYDGNNNYFSKYYSEFKEDVTMASDDLIKDIFNKLEVKDKENWNLIEVETVYNFTKI